MEELKPCPFCGCKYGMHEGNCYIYMIATHERFDAVNHGMLFTDGELKKAWNTRGERTCKNVYTKTSSWLLCSKCGYVTQAHKQFDGDSYVKVKFCSVCGAKVVSE